MQLKIYTRSNAFQTFAQNSIGQYAAVRLQFASTLESPDSDDPRLCLLHISSFGSEALGWLNRYAKNSRMKIAVCADRPDIVEMLECVRVGAKAYCNSHMQAALYQQMLRLLENGQSWFPPDLLQQTFSIAQSALAGKDTDKLLAELTAREKQIAIAVSEGKSNRQIAQQMAISEPTVKTHLTRIFKKLDLKDRLSLALLLS
jgi:DNA-binding NarL/FixJ family response regulator